MYRGKLRLLTSHQALSTKHFLLNQDRHGNRYPVETF
jgi:hypothetical protein